MRKWFTTLALVFIVAGIAALPALAQIPEGKPPTVKELQENLEKANATIGEIKTGAKVSADTMWVMITGMLVFFMNLGFACVESGFCRAKNCVNILSKNFIVFAATTIGFWAVGWGIMFGNGSPWYGEQGLVMVEGQDNSPATGSLATTIKGDIKSKYFEKMDDEAFKKELEGDKYAKLNDAITAVFEDPGKSTVKLKEKDADGKETEKAVLKVKLDVPGKGAFEGNYDPAVAYAGAYSALSWTGVPLWAKFFFQLVFAGTAATIVSGAVAERIKYHSFIIFSFIMAIFIYPVVGHWIWGGGILQSKGFLDFAGSTQVHSIGGWAALAGIIILGPRIGKYSPDGKVNAIPGHNLTAATIGCFVLWFGWFGFNPGSTMAADGAAIAEVAITTNLAAAAATLTATITAWLLLGKPDLGMTLNGCLAGLVAITAPCAFVTAGASVIIGAIAGVLVVLAVLMFDRIRIDDPVGATSVHLVNGVFGTICVGLFATPDRLARAGNPEAVAGFFYGGGTKQLMTQLTGVGLTAAYVLVAGFAAWILLRLTIGIRVSAEEEVEGLDIGEHGNEAYHGFVLAHEMTTGGAEPRPAKAPSGAKRFAIVVEGVGNGELVHAWSEMCQPGKASDPKTFKEVYKNMTTVQGNRFVFRGGDPETMKAGLQQLLNDKVKGKMTISVQG